MTARDHASAACGVKTLDRTHRDNLLAEYVRYHHARMHGGSAELGMDAKAAEQAAENALASYFAELPRVQLSRCPFTGDPVTGAFDAWGFDGPWWLGSFLGSEVRAGGGMLRLMMGAVALGQEPPEQPIRGDAHIGPGAPFVVPSVLELPGMQAVISQIEMSKKRRAYTICYFSLEAPKPWQLYQWWRHTSMGWTHEGKSGWAIKTDPWDFDLRKWIANGRLRWINPGDPEMAIADPEPSKCPYLDLDGVRMQQIVSKTGVRTIPPPDGEEIDPFA